MHKAVVSSLLVLTTFVVVAAHAEQPKSPQVPVKPVIPNQPVKVLPGHIDVPPIITAVRTSTGAPYDKGPVNLQVEVHNRSKGALDTSLNISNVKVPVRLSSGERGWFNVAAPELRHACRPTTELVELVGVANSRKRVVITPSCTFTGKFTGPTAVVPTTVAGKVWAGGFRFRHYKPAESHSAPELLVSPKPFPLACGEWLDGKATVKNQTSRRVKVGLLLDGVNTEYPDADCRAANNCPDGKEFFDPNQSRSMQFGGMNFGSFDGRPGPIVVTIAAEDPSTPIVQPNAQVEITRACTLAVELQ